jgi:hypothetical protein
LESNKVEETPHESRMSENNPLAEKNMFAIACLQDGRHKEAAQALKQALGFIKSSLSTENLPGRENPETFASQCSFLSEGLSLPCSSRVSNNTDSVFQIFDHAFLLPNDAWCSANQSRTSGIILYNLGLVHHLASEKVGRDRELRTACNLYQMALSIIEGCIGDVDSDDLLLLQFLALFNNMGQIHATFFAKSEMDHCTSAVQALVSRKASDQRLHQSEAFIFFQSSSMLMQKTSLYGLAPAA